jgi:signal transduction histidine kinase
MAHDLRNPLAAARGAAEFLVEEMRRSGEAQHRDFAVLIIQQLDRLGAVIERYHRLSKLEPAPIELDLNALVRRVLSLQEFAAGSDVRIEHQLAEPSPRLKADPDLLASALENLVKNGLEAMPAGGTLTVRTQVGDEGSGPIASLSVEDTGKGMDARAREQAFEPFFTTKANGSGLGLAFVQQVARAHEGEVLLTSREGSGTIIEVALPLAPR